MWWGERKVPWSALITAIFLVGFGLVSLALGDDRWIKAKPSIVYLFFAGALATGLMTRRPLLKFVLGSQIDATDAQWRRLSVNFTLFFIALAALNEVLWRGIDLFMVQYFAGLPGSPKRSFLPSVERDEARLHGPQFCFYNVAVVAPASGQN